MDFSLLSVSSAAPLLLALPALLLPYLFRRRARRVVVPGLFLYEGLAAAATQGLWGRLQLAPLFLLQLLILLLLILSAARPVVHSRGGSVALVLDTSASMQARGPDGTTRVFELAKQELWSSVQTTPDGERIGLFTSAPSPKKIAESISGRGWSSALFSPGGPPFESESSLRRLLERIEASDTPDPSDEVLSVFFTQLFAEEGFRHLVFFTDRPLALSARAHISVVQLGEPGPNLGITGFRLYRSPFFPDTVEATLRVEGVAPTQGWRVGIEDAETGQQLRSLAASADQETFSFTDLPVARSYRARLLIEDDLGLDNEAYAVLPPPRAVSGLLVTPLPARASGLSQIPSLRLEQLSPHDYCPEMAARFPFVLFHLTAPASLPSSNAAFVLPPEGNAVFPLGRSATEPDMTRWTVGHPLVSYVHIPLLKPAFGQALSPPAWSKTVVHATPGPLILAGERRGYRYAAVGFDLLPYLGRQNLPVSILTLNLLSWLVGQAGLPPSLKTGTSLTLGGPSPQVSGPASQPLPVAGHSLRLLKQGVYRVTEYGQPRRLAVNLSSAEESRLGRPLRLAVPAPLRSEQTAQRPVWPWLIVAVVLLVCLERWLGTKKNRLSRSRGRHAASSVPEEASSAAWE